MSQRTLKRVEKMGKTIEALEISKIFNNNVVMVNDGSGEKIFVGKGIGFGKKPGEVFKEIAKVEKVFAIEQPDHSEKFGQLIERVDNETIGLCEEIIHMISEELREALSERIHIALTDHIQFLLYRLRNKNEITNPFLMEIQTLYKQEFRIAQKAVEMLKKSTKLDIPEEETGFIALHIYAARRNNDLSETLKFTFLCNTITETIEDELGMEIDRTSLDYARFLTHIRFAIQRTLDGNPIKNELLSVTRTKLKKFFKVAGKVAKLIEEELKLKVVEDEVGYITLHIARFNRNKEI